MYDASMIRKLENEKKKEQPNIRKFEIENYDQIARMINFIIHD